MAGTSWGAPPSARGEMKKESELKAGRADSASRENRKAQTPQARASGFAAPLTLRKAAEGLTLERYFTRPGVDPFDEVEWEIRSAVIASEKGEIVFEQKDVEVPKFWSQTATNVVASKYFRGTLGTPERERSVKQLIGRVVRTIGGWGRAQGYFNTEADAQTFEAELKHLLVYQKMSFNSPVWFNVGVEPKSQCSACFINSVEDTMDSILTLAKTEGMLFKYGSGTGTNLSPLRSSKELLAGGGTASGPVSFMKGYDAFAGVIKSGGKTRRAAKMVILNVDHPDIVEFIKCKQEEEKKAWALIDAGYSSALDGPAYSSIFFQNSNNSVRVTDDFMQAVVADGEWQTKRVMNGEPFESYKARDLTKMIAEATWACGDPGMQFDTTVNEWHPCPASGRINASNPCVAGDTLVATAEGLVPIRDLVGRKMVEIVTKDGGVAPVTEIFRTGVKPTFLLRTRAGYTLKVTNDHPIWTTNRGDVKAEDLKPEDVLTLVPGRFGQKKLATAIAELIGTATATGSRTGENGRVLPSQDILALVDEYAVFNGNHSTRRLTQAAFCLDREATAALLSGLFSAGGFVSVGEDKSVCVSLDSTSVTLLRQVQHLLLEFGIKATVIESQEIHSLRVSRNACLLFERWIGFNAKSDKAAKLRELNANVAAYNDPLTDAFESLTPLGEEEVFDLMEPRDHHFIAGGILVHNCSEYMFLDDTACNLASLNLMKLCNDAGELDVPAYKRAIETTILAQEIIVDNASYPTQRIADNSHSFRPLGLGYANLGALLMSRGLAYDSDAGRDYAGAITAGLPGPAGVESARIAQG